MDRPVVAVPAGGDCTLMGSDKAAIPFASSTMVEHEPRRTVVLVAADHPFPHPQTLRDLLVLEGDAVIALDAGWQQVTCAVYRPAFLRAASAALNAGCHSIIAGLDLVSVNLIQEPTRRSWGKGGRSWLSVDTPDQLNEGLRRSG